MKLCEYCFHINESTAKRCSHCQRELPDKLFSARDHPTTSQHEGEPALAPAQPGTHTQHLGRMEPDTVALYVENTSNPLILRVENQIVLGRYTPDNPGQPPVDLEPYDAFEKGVSRLHAAIRRTAESDFVIMDLGSTNGTSVNGEALTPHEPLRLRNGDLIRLGALSIFFYGPQ